SREVFRCPTGKSGGRRRRVGTWILGSEVIPDPGGHHHDCLDLGLGQAEFAEHGSDVIVAELKR
ncbi:hypothetical protein KZ294_27980, partial [Escherichia coli]|nr:hypothetical protein [Escherichia coli]